MFEPQFARRNVVAVAAALITFTCTNNGHAAVIYSTEESTYFQDFDSLPNTPENVILGSTENGVGWTDDSSAPGASQFSIPGWYLYHSADLGITGTREGGVNGHQRVRIGPGSSNVGAFWSFGGGVSGTADRALGSVASNTLTGVGTEVYIGLRVHNATGLTLQSFTLSYRGEQWRDGGAAVPNAQNLTFMWSTTATAISDANSLFAVVPELGFTSPVFAHLSGGAAVDGNVAGLFNVSAFTVEGLNWAPGTDLWLRWADVNDSGNDHGLAIDDLNFSASTLPEPATCGMLSLGLLALLGRRQRRA
jgi:hypothetical protein